VIVRSDFKVVHSQQNRSLPPKSEAD
jgi:hypothetical protein